MKEYLQYSILASDNLPKIAETIRDIWRCKLVSSAVAFASDASTVSAQVTSPAFSSVQIFFSDSKFFFSFSCSETLNSNLELAF